MSKSVMIIDTPRDCCECPFGTMAFGKSICLLDEGNGIDCPLKPYKDSIPIELYEQVKGERDVAIEQLKALNIELFEKPYLKAIPIEWIEKYKRVRGWEVTVTTQNAIDNMLNAWEKENAEDN